MKKIILAVIFLSLYTVFWIRFLAPNPTKVSGVPPVSQEETENPKSIDQEKPHVLGSESVQLPAAFNISFIPRRQQFGLSCEFSAAASIIYHYTGNAEFAVSNSLQAEKTLIKQVGVSENPNLGIRMGSVLPKDLNTLFANLNQRFGGADYYGVHAPPFVDVFAEYGLSSKILEKGNIEEIKQAMYNGHVVMTWIKVGYNTPIDTALSYGPVSIIRGEHAVVIHGYDSTGFEIMDPGIGVNRHVSFENMITASKDFVAPFLEVYPLPKRSQDVGDVYQFGNATGLARSHLSIEIQNASGITGAGDQLAEVLKDFGYSIVGIKTASKSEDSGLDLSVKQTDRDFLYVLTRDLQAANYGIATVSADLSASSSAHAIITVRN